MNHFMIDLETLSTEPNAMVLSIGITHFTQSQGCSLSASWNPSIEEQEGRHISFSTVNWWTFQSDEARAAAFHDGRDSIELVHLGLSHYIREYVSKSGSEARTFWANSPAFDMVILNSLFKDHIPLWSFREWADYRTLKMLHSMLGFELEKKEIPHMAASDSRLQAENVLVMLSDIKKRRGL